MKNLKEKLRKNGGFTLVEMLIVVAIIAILIAVSIPMIGSALERSKEAVDQANIRDAISLGTVEYLSQGDRLFDTTTNGGYTVNGTGKDAVVVLYYVVDPSTHQGSIAKEAGTAATNDAFTPKCSCNSVTTPLFVNVTKDGTVTASWGSDANGKTTTGTATASAANPNPGNG